MKLLMLSFTVFIFQMTYIAIITWAQTILYAGIWMQMLLIVILLCVHKYHTAFSALPQGAHLVGIGKEYTETIPMI